jgi:putative copper export protein
MRNDNSVARSLHDIGLASWFGGSLMGAVGLNGAASAVEEPRQRLRVASSGWDRWTPLNFAGIVAHLAGGALLTVANKGRLTAQRGVGQASLVKTGLTVAALGATAWSRALGAKLDRAGEVPVEGGTDPGQDTPEDVAKAQRQLKRLQWVIPALTGAVLVVNARMGEQQRPAEVAKGLARRLLPVGKAA